MIPAAILLSSLVQLAPSITKLFKGGEATQEMAEMAATAARTITGTTSNDAALDALRGDPAKVLELQQVLLSHAKEMEELVIRDRSDARARDVQFLSAGTRNYRADMLVAVSVVIVCIILAVVIVFPEVSEFAKGALTTILGVFLNQLTNVFAFEFGTTKSSRETQSQLVQEYIKS